MAANKSVNKSIRVTEEIFCYIDGFQGDGFNQKLENMVLDSMVTEKRRKATLAALDKQIASQREQLQKLMRDCDVFTQIRRQAIYLERDINALKDNVDKVVAEHVQSV